MTTIAEPNFRHYKTDPDCRGDRHRPEHRSYIRGCRCAGTVAAQEEWLSRQHRVYRRTAMTIPADGDPDCPGMRHTPTRDSWRKGCRCPGTLAANDRWRGEMREQREAVVAYWHKTGECTARAHDSRRAYAELGCRCELAVKLNKAWADRKRPRTRTRQQRMQEIQETRRLPVSRVNLLLLLDGFRDQPTLGEWLAADVRLSAIRVPDGPRHSRPLTTLEITERLGCSDITVHRARRARIQLREERHLRRLADVRARAERVARRG